MRGGALVTGGARRVGRALALALADAGFDVAVHHRGGGDEAREVCEAIRAKGRRATAVAADLAQADALADVVARAREGAGPLTVLVNSASLFEDDRIGRVTAQGLDAHLAANLKAPVLLAQAFAAQVEGPDGEACVVNLLDQRVLKPNPQFFSYSLSKAALAWATRTMAQALAPRVRVNAIGPGPTLPSVHQSPEAFAAEAAAVPLGRGSPPPEIAAALLYLVGARAVTGQMIAVDGGQHLAWKTPDIP